MRIFAISISNAVDKVHYEAREKEYLATVARYSKDELNTITECFADYVMSIDAHPFQDFLGRLYMLLELSNHWKGQFFTPYHMCKLMAEISLGSGLEQEIEEKGWISVCDPCCGGGAMLIAAAEVAHEHKIDFQNHILFVAQDIDPVVALMCYIQLSLLGCPGYVKIGNSLSEPMTGPALYAPEGEHIWITPMYMNGVWDMRRKVHLMDALFRTATGDARQDQEEGHEAAVDLLGNTITVGGARRSGSARRKPSKERKGPERPMHDTISMFDLGAI